MTKKQAIKEIEKLTGYEYKCEIKENYYPVNGFRFSLGVNLEYESQKYDEWVDLYIAKDKIVFNDKTYDFDINLPLSWLEPLSKLIPILFKEQNDPR